MPVAVLPTAKLLSAFSLKPKSDRLLGGPIIGARRLTPGKKQFGDMVGSFSTYPIVKCGTICPGSEVIALHSRAAMLDRGRMRPRLSWILA